MVVKKNILLSMIIPVYKVEKYINECVESLITEKSDAIEIILVDDGSPDNCPKICDEWVLKDKRIKCIHQENGGLSYARNQGLNIAQGKYISFLDSDDKIYPGAISKVVEYLNNPKCEFDLCFMNINKFNNENRILENDDKILKKHIKGKSKTNIIKYLTSKGKYPGSACSKIYSREFLSVNNIKFPEDKRCSEDLGFVFDCIIYAKKYDSLDFSYYLYRKQSQESITSTISNKRVQGLEIFIEESINKLGGCLNNINKDGRNLLAYVAYEFQILMYFYYKLGIADNSFLIKYKWILKYGKTLKGRIIYLLTRFCGINVASKIIAKIKG